MVLSTPDTEKKGSSAKPQAGFFAFLGHYVTPWHTLERKIGSLCQTEDSCSARNEDDPSLPGQRAHGCPPTNTSAALDSHTKAAHANPAEAPFFSSPACLQPPSSVGWSSVCSWQEPQEWKFLYQVCKAS